MPKYSVEVLGAMVNKKRGERNLRETAKEIGIGPATLMRIESGRTPDIDTFGKICRWLGVSPGQYLGFDSTETQSTSQPVSAHLRADKNLQLPTANALAQMIIFATKMQTTTPEGGTEGGNS